MKNSKVSARQTHSTVTVRVASPAEAAAFDAQLANHHDLGAGRPVGDYLRQTVERDGVPVALLVLGPACYSLKDRDLWISWSAPQRVTRLKRIVPNRRFLVLTAKGQSPNLASQAMGAAVRALSDQWREHFGDRPLLAESFPDPEAYAGTCYKASNWEPVGFSAGYSRQRADFYVANERPQKPWLRELGPKARAHLRAAQVPAESRAGQVAPPSGVLPGTLPQMKSLGEVFRAAPDPRDRNTHYRIGPVLTRIAMARLAGRRAVAEIVRFATTLPQGPRRQRGRPRKQGPRAFYKVPGSGVFYAVLTRMDAEAFATLLSPWLWSRAGTLPQALAMDGKLIRDPSGLLTLAQHEDGAPQARAVYDQKEGTDRGEQTAATALIERLPALDGKRITADPLHCQRKPARVIVEKGGDYLLQIKGNQPKLFQQAQALDALLGTPLLARPTADTDGSKSARSMPLPGNR